MKREKNGLIFNKEVLFKSAYTSDLDKKLKIFFCWHVKPPKVEK